MNAGDSVLSAIKRLEPGGTIVLGVGVHQVNWKQNWWVGVNKQRLHKITIEAEIPGLVIVRALPGALNVFEIHEVNNVTLDGLVIDASAARTNGVLINDTTSCNLVNTTVLNAPHNGIKALPAAKSVTLINVSVRNNGFGAPAEEAEYQHAVYSQAITLSVYGLRVRKSAGGGLLVRRKSGVPTNPASVVVRNLRAVNCPRGGLIVLNTDLADIEDVHVYNEMYVEREKPVYGSYEAVSLNDSVNVQLRNLVVSGSEIGVSVRPTAQNVVVNDVFFANCGTGLWHQKRAVNGVTRLQNAVYSGCAQETFTRNAEDLLVDNE